MKGWQTQFADLREQVRGNARLKIALLAAGALLATFVLQELDALRRASEARSIEAEVDLGRMQALKGQDVWRERAVESEKLLAALRAEIPIVATPGLAQAGLQNWLRELAASAGEVTGLDIAVASVAPVESLDGLIKVRATLNAGMSPRQATDLIRKIESAANLVVIDALSIRSDQNRTASITITAYYRTPASAISP